MADIDLHAPHGSVSVTIDLAKTKDGNKALAEARIEAAHLAKAEGRLISSEAYGTSRDGNMLIISFPLAPDARSQ